MEPQSKCIKKMLEDNFFEENSNQELIGLKVLDLFYLKAKQSDTEKQLLNKNLVFNTEGLTDTIIEKIGISDTSHLKMCLGQIVIDSQYQNLVEIQEQILRLLGKKQEKKKKKLQFSMNDTLSSQKTQVNQKFLYNPYKQQKSKLTSLSSTIFSAENYQPPIMRSEEIKISQQTLNSTLKNLTISNISSKQQFSDLSGISMHSEIDPENEELFKTFQVEYYLQNEVVSYNSELNLLLQQNAESLKYLYEKDQMNLDSPIKICKNGIVVKDILTGNYKEIELQGKGKNKKDAKSDFSFKVLRIIYTEYPGIAFKMKLYKKQKGIKH